MVTPWFKAQIPDFSTPFAWWCWIWADWTIYSSKQSSIQICYFSGNSAEKAYQSHFWSSVQSPSCAPPSTVHYLNPSACWSFGPLFYTFGRILYPCLLSTSVLFLWPNSFRLCVWLFLGIVSSQVLGAHGTAPLWSYLPAPTSYNH